MLAYYKVLTFPIWLGAPQRCSLFYASLNCEGTMNLYCHWLNLWIEGKERAVTWERILLCGFPTPVYDSASPASRLNSCYCFLSSSTFTLITIIWRFHTTFSSQLHGLHRGGSSGLKGERYLGCLAAQNNIFLPFTLNPKKMPQLKKKVAWVQWCPLVFLATQEDGLIPGVQGHPGHNSKTLSQKIK